MEVKIEAQAPLRAAGYCSGANRDSDPKRWRKVTEPQRESRTPSRLAWRRSQPKTARRKIRRRALRRSAS